MDKYQKIAFSVSKNIQIEMNKLCLPPSEGSKAETYHILYNSLFNNTRGYLVKLNDQINGCYEKGWYDGAAILIRRLIEILIIEIYEHNEMLDKIKDNSGNFKGISDLISIIMNEKKWSLEKTTIRTLPKIKELGHISAHGRRYNTHRQDIDDIKIGLRTTVKEFLYLSELK